MSDSPSNQEEQQALVEKVPEEAAADAEDEDSDESLAKELLEASQADDGIQEEDAWIEELECALLADCDTSTLRKVTEGRRIPAHLRPDYWRALLALSDTAPVKLSHEYDLPNQQAIRSDCEKLVNDIVSNSHRPEQAPSDADRLRLLSDFESTITTYVKARPELCFAPNNGWTDVLRVLHELDLHESQLYQMFFRIVDRYIPRDLEPPAPQVTSPETRLPSSATSKLDSNAISSTRADTSSQPPSKQAESSTTPAPNTADSQKSSSALSERKTAQAYHLLRLLIQYHDPELCSILDSRGVTPRTYVKDWFSTLFARSCSLNQALLIWDTHFKMADPFLIFFAAIVMVVNASDELKAKGMGQQEMLNILKSMPGRLEQDDIEDLYYLVSNHYTNFTPRSIRSYSHLFFMDTFGNTYSGNDSPDASHPLTDIKTCSLTSSLDLSRYLCLPIVPAEIFALDTAHLRNSPTHASALRYFLVDCRPADQYNAGHLTKAFHLDCSLMLREPSAFANAVQALLEIQRQVVASKSSTGGQHLCFIGNGHEEEDLYVNMVVASFLQKYQKYVSLVVGGFDAIHDYVRTKSELKDSFSEYIIDHNIQHCKPCIIRGEKAPQPPKSTTSNQSSTNTPEVSMLDKFATAFVSRSNVFKDKLVESLSMTGLPSSPLSFNSSSDRAHVSSRDKLGRRYTGASLLPHTQMEETAEYLSPLRDQKNPIQRVAAQEVQISTWQQQENIIAFHKCSQIKCNNKYPGYIALSKDDLWILREIPHNKGYASIVAKRPLEMVVQIVSKRRQPHLIIFRYGHAGRKETVKPEGETSGSNSTNQDTNSELEDKSLPSIIASDQLHIPEAFEVIRVIKREIVRIMDESSKSPTEAQSITAPEPSTSLPINQEPS